VAQTKLAQTASEVWLATREAAKRPNRVVRKGGLDGAAIGRDAVLFLLMNSEKQEVSFVFFSVNTRLIWLILLSMLLGAALARFLPHWWRSRGEKPPG